MGILSYDRTVTIASGASLSDALELPDLRTIIAIQMPSSWTAADITFEVSYDGTTYVPLYWDGSEFTASAAASYGLSLEPAVLAGWPFVKLRSGTSGTPVNQAAERELTVLIRSV